MRGGMVFAMLNAGIDTILLMSAKWFKIRLFLIYTVDTVDYVYKTTYPKTTYIIYRKGMTEKQTPDNTILIRIRKETAEKLRKYGMMGDSYDDVICRIMEGKQ